MAIRNGTMDKFNSSYWKASIGAASGPGPMAEVWARWMSQYLSETPSVWTRCATDGLYTIVNYPPWLISALVSTELTEDFAFAGFVMRTAILTGLDLLPISPFVLGVVLNSVDICFEDALIEKVTPELWDRMQSWPPKELPGSRPPRLDVRLGSNVASLLIDSDIGIPISAVRYLPQDICESVLQRPILLSLMFKITITDPEACDPNRFWFNEDHIVSMSLKAGFFHEEARFPKIERIFSLEADPRALDTLSILATYYGNRRVIDSDSVLSLVDFASTIKTTSLGYDGTVKYDICIKRFEALFAKYLSTPGHVEASSVPDVSEIKDTHPYLDDVHPKALRPFLFIQAVTGSRYLPLPHRYRSKPLKVYFFEY
ncbi:hypothetical protein DFP72DRAFT_1084403 [Ephemerocybe angulata]|uniref:Uncharacterized protein n=1 Tax=Ephemerocybe angulata TaxID=980116 RepID=A0A8H6LUI7_9AGAR|nr:hypothetical protein DFP72DRAFT_1084403 [Tulosesus angulatus]